MEMESKSRGLARRVDHRAVAGGRGQRSEGARGAQHCWQADRRRSGAGERRVFPSSSSDQPRSGPGIYRTADHLFQRVTQDKGKVIDGFANAMSEVVAASYLASGTYPVEDRYFVAIRKKVVRRAGGSTSLAWRLRLRLRADRSGAVNERTKLLASVPSAAGAARRVAATRRVVAGTAKFVGVGGMTSPPPIPPTTTTTARCRRMPTKLLKLSSWDFMHSKEPWPRSSWPSAQAAQHARQAGYSQ
eukprot:COSAG04_NODE_2161_length_4653_cov_10.099473_2_plen_245_part_00